MDESNLVNQLKPLFFEKANRFTLLTNIRQQPIQEELWKVYCDIIKDGQIDMFNAEISTFFDDILFRSALALNQEVLLTRDDRVKRLQELVYEYQLCFQVHQYLPIPEWGDNGTIHLGPSSEPGKTICGDRVPYYRGEDVLYGYPISKKNYCSHCLHLLDQNGLFVNRTLYLPCEVLR